MSSSHSHAPTLPLQYSRWKMDGISLSVTEAKSKLFDILHNNKQFPWPAPESLGNNTIDDIDMEAMVRNYSLDLFSKGNDKFQFSRDQLYEDICHHLGISDSDTENESDDEKHVLNPTSNNETKIKLTAKYDEWNDLPEPDEPEYLLNEPTDPSRPSTYSNLSKEEIKKFYQSYDDLVAYCHHFEDDNE